MSDMRVIDGDTHLSEPPDLFTSRLPKKWQGQAPRVEVNEVGEHRWRVGQSWLGPVAAMSVAGAVDVPARWEDVDPACYEREARLRWMDANGIHTQVLYPNVVAFEGHAIMALEDPELKLACIRANNDHFAEFAAGTNDRFIALASMPFWDIDASITEMERCAEAGHRGVVWAATLVKHGLPATTDPYWDRFYGAAQAMGMSINFHVGVGYTEAQINIANQRGGMVKTNPLDQAADQARRTALGFMSNGRTIADLIMSGLCDRFPDLNFVSVESGFGYVPYLLESLDWQWTNAGNNKRFPQRLLPSEYFRRQIYTMFWFEQDTLPLLALYPDNVLFETDFPHDTSLTPGPGSNAPRPKDLIDSHIETYGVDLMRRILQDNATKLYRVGGQ